jgi:hypothetical protein
VKVGIRQIDGKYPNLALMKLSAWHKRRGDKVEWFMPLDGEYDVVYASKVFDYTPDDIYLPVDTIRGGTGYDLTKKLGSEIELMVPDYSIYPTWDAAIGFTTRGCPRNCPYCVVPEKEGPLSVVTDIDGFWTGQDRVVLLDNNLTAAPFEHFEHVLLQCIVRRLKVDFCQGLDIRLITWKHARLLARVQTFKRIHFAFDRLCDEPAVRAGVKTLVENGVPVYRLMFYVLIGYDSAPEEDLYRVEVLRELGVDPFVMPFDKYDRYQEAFAAWVNTKPVFKTIPWKTFGTNRTKGELRI